MREIGLEKGALLLLALGPDEAATVMKNLPQDDVQKIGLMMATMPPQPRSRVETIIDELFDYKAQGAMIEGTEDHILDILTKTVGADKATQIMEKINHGTTNPGIEGLKRLEATTISDLIKEEHPQIIATILVHLDFDQAGEIIKSFPERLRNDVVLRVATLNGVQPNALRELNEAITPMLTGALSSKKASMGGVRYAAEILNFVGASAEKLILDNVREHDADLAQRIYDNMFVFENLVDIDDRSMQTLLRDVPQEVLVIAIKGASEELKARIMKNMSSRAAEILQEEIDTRGPVKLTEVETAQKEILKIARQLSQDGTITISSKNESYV